MQIQRVPLSQIQVDAGRFQFRASTVDMKRVEQLAANWDEASLDPIDLWQSADSGLFLISGHHRYYAALKRSIADLPARIHVMSANDAQLYALKSNANRVEYSAFEKAKCLTYLIEKEGYSREDCAKTMNLSSTDMVRKYYSLRIFEGTRWLDFLDKPGVLAIAFEVGSNCEKNPMTTAELDKVLEIIIANDLGITQVRQLFRDLEDCLAVSSTPGLFDTDQFTSRVVRAVRQRDALNQLAAATWWLYELIKRDENYQVPDLLRVTLLILLEQLYAFCIGSEQAREIPNRNPNQKRKSIKSQLSK